MLLGGRVGSWRSDDEDALVQKRRRVRHAHMCHMCRDVVIGRDHVDEEKSIPCPSRYVLSFDSLPQRCAMR